jgi:hypothetical protein
MGDVGGEAVSLATRPTARGAAELSYVRSTLPDNVLLRRPHDALPLHAPFLYLRGREGVAATRSPSQSSSCPDLAQSSIRTNTYDWYVVRKKLATILATKSYYYCSYHYLQNYSTLT